jgi:hypothetical protein
MRIEQHVNKTFEEMLKPDFDSALMNACLGLDGTCKKYFQKDFSSASLYKKMIRDYYWLIEPMIGAGINLEETKFDNLNIKNGKGYLIDHPDLADIIYHVFRCSHAHGDDTPLNYRFSEWKDGKHVWILADNFIQMPINIIWALTSIIVFSKANSNINTCEDCYLTWGAESLGVSVNKFIVKDYWGKEDDIKTFFESKNLIRIKLDNLNFN